MPPKKARSEKNQPKISFFTTSEKENPWSEDETDTGTTTETMMTYHTKTAKTRNKEISVPLGQFIHMANIRQR
jgi:hypothetical protein